MSACSSNSSTSCRRASVSCLNMAGVIYAQCCSFTSKPGVFFCCCYACLLSCAVTHELRQENRSVNNPFHSFSLEPEPNDRLNDNYADCCRVTWYGHIYYQNWVFPGNDFAQVVSHPDPTETRQLHFTTKLSQAVNTTAIVWTSISSLIWMIPVLVLRLIHWKQSIN